jgi:parallel beta-helix repeat protein
MQGRVGYLDNGPYVDPSGIRSIPELLANHIATVKALGAVGVWHDWVFQGVLASRPAAGFPNRLFYATDTKKMFIDKGDTWEQIVGGGTSPFIVVDAAGRGDYTTITQGLAALGTNPGSVFVRAGVYPNETIPLQLRSNQALIGESMGSVVILPPANATGNGVIELVPTPTPYGYVSLDNVMVVNIEIDGHLMTNDVSGVYAYALGDDPVCRPASNAFGCGAFGSCPPGYLCSPTAIVLEGVRVWNVPGRGFDLRGGTWEIQRCSAAGCGRSGFYLSYTLPINPDYSAGGVLFACLAYYNGQRNIAGDKYGIYLNVVQTLFVSYVACLGNRGDNIHAYAGTLQQTTGAPQLFISNVVTMLSVSGDEVSIYGFSDFKVVDSLFLITAGSVGLRLSNCANGIIAGNNFASAGQMGIYVEGCSYINSVGNVFGSDTGNPTYPIYIGPGCSNLQSVMDNFRNNSNAINAPYGGTNLTALFLYPPDGSVNLVTFSGTSPRMYIFTQTGDIIRTWDGKKVQWV